ncbi:hypothetical protein C5Z25_02075 [Lactobacillus sp. CBA3605]|uniref:tetratricopeptide repeat protein n=1 Tax=Lactobacillus sp. CBA3605 TaxID=2099788 RepID=UPI000CFB7561|nr:tetratricopeptide repeat protein [Lactobacillus sp. CBA3605]AVK60633.1 hypothetical protein C5Z25_02075 [Lactobacillus sp. CBA3605]
MAKTAAATKAAQQALIHQLVTTIDHHPDDYQAYYDLTVVLTAGQDYEQAEALAMKALGRFDQVARAHNLLTYALGNIYYQAGEYNRALAAYQTIDDPKLKADAYLMMAQTLMAKKDYQHALVWALTAQEQRPTAIDVNLLTANILLALGNNEQAYDFYQKVLVQDPQHGPANFNAGLTAMVLGKPYAQLFARAKQYDAAYFKAHQQQLSDIEKTVTVADKVPHKNQKK